MPLIVSSPITIATKPPASISEKASYVFIRVPSRWLSKPYELEDGDVISGQILEIRYGDEKLEGLSNTAISFVLWPVGGVDFLYVHKDSWPLLRDHGIVYEGHFMEVKLDTVFKPSGECVKLYPARELRVEVG